MKLTVKKEVDLFGFRTIKPSDYWTFGLSNLRTIGPSDYWTFGLSDLRTIGPSDYWTFGLSDRHHTLFWENYNIQLAQT
jgi:hypothetical protein